MVLQILCIGFGKTTFALDLSTFFSMSFTASFSFSFSSARGSILRIRCYQCSAVHAMLCTNIKNYRGPHPSKLKIDSADMMLTSIWFMVVVRMDRSLFTSRGVSSSSTTTTLAPRLRRFEQSEVVFPHDGFLRLCLLPPQGAALHGYSVVVPSSRPLHL